MAEKEPMSDERLAVMRYLAKHGVMSWSDQNEVVAEVDRLRAALAAAERARDEAWDGEWRTIPQTREQAEKALMTWTKKSLVQRFLHEQQASIQRQDTAVNMLMGQRDSLARRADRAEAALARVTDDSTVEAAAKAAYEQAFLKHAPEYVDRWDDLVADNAPAAESWREVVRAALRAVAAGEQDEPRYPRNLATGSYTVPTGIAAKAYRRNQTVTPAPGLRLVDRRDPECVKAWPECSSMEYDSRCCRFPKSCSAGTWKWEPVDEQTEGGCGAVNPRTGWTCSAHRGSTHRAPTGDGDGDFYDWEDDRG